MKRAGIFLIMVALIAGMVGCEPTATPQYDLTIGSTAGGEVTIPGEGTFTYDEGTAVNLTAEAEGGYQFVNWTGDVGTIGNVNNATTTITMHDNYSIAANFEETPPRTGAWVDEVVITREPTASAAVQQLKNDALDIFAYGLSDASLYADVVADPDLTSADSLGGRNEFTFNPVGPIFPSTGKLNPFAVPAFREAMHWLIDRDYIARDIMSGLAMPTYTCLNDNFPDAKERYPDLIAAVEAEYAHDPTKAAGIITTEMEKLGAVFEGGKWLYDGEPVELIFLIMVEDERKDIGDYFAGLLEDLGFTVTRQYGTGNSLRLIWVVGDPSLGLWHIYTGGWVSAVIARDEGYGFGQFYTNLEGPMVPLWQAYVNDPVFYEAAEKLWNHDYATMAERRELFEICLPMSMNDNVRMFLATHKLFTPMRDNVRVAHDLCGGVDGSWMWALTAHFADDEGEPEVGGTLRVAMPDLLIEPWNPIAGSDWPCAYDAFLVRATGDMGLQPDTRTGLPWPGRIERAEVYVQEGLPVDITHDWLTLEFLPEILVPPDAWADWDAAEQRFITVAERFPEGTTARTKSVVYYPKDIFEVPLHDGSTLSMGDFILYTILRFDRAKEASAIYDETAVSEFDAFMSMFKGVKFITDNPDYGLIVETYSDVSEIDAELSVTTWFPSSPTYTLWVYHRRGRPAFWHIITVGWLAEESSDLAFSSDKAATLSVEWMDYTRGPGLPILKKWMDWATTENYIPYAPTLGDYISADEAAERWASLQDWYAEKGHFWVGSGPFYLEAVYPVDKIVHLKRFEDYPDRADKWLFLLEPLG